MSDLFETFQLAESHLKARKYENALEIYLSLEKDATLQPICHYRIAEISNIIGDPENAYRLYYSALNAAPNLASTVLPQDSPNSKYVFPGLFEEKERTDCPLCGKTSNPLWCYPLFLTPGYNFAINPVRMWMKCDDCNHLFAKHFPDKLFLHNTNPRTPNPAYFSYYSDVLTHITRFTNGKKLLEVGIGASECMLAAGEMGYETFGLDVIEKHVEHAKNHFGLNVITADFNEFESNEKYDVIIMGDVLEHVNDPVSAVEKAASLLSPTGVLWISTPNFESAFSIVNSHYDPMRYQTYHLNYFSRLSLYSLAARFGLEPVSYQISRHYNGSMEVILTIK